MPQTDSWPSPLTPHIGTQAPELDPSALVSCDICWWVQVRPLPLGWSCPSWSSCWWETSGLLHPRNGWKCRPIPHGMGCFPFIRQIGAGGGGWHGQPVTLHCHLGPKSPSLGRVTFQRKFVLEDATPHTARNTRNFLAGEEVEVMQWPARSPDLNPIEHISEQMRLFIRDMDNPPNNGGWVTGAPVASLGCSDPWKDGGPCMEHASTTEGRDGCQGRWYPILTHLQCSRKISIQFSLQFVSYLPSAVNKSKPDTLDKIPTHTMQGFVFYIKRTTISNTELNVSSAIVIFVTIAHRVVKCLNKPSSWVLRYIFLLLQIYLQLPSLPSW